MSNSSARAFWITGPRRGELRDEKLAPPGDGERLIRTLYTGVSRGTEALVFENRVPDSEHERMRAPFQAGTFPYPVKYGYSSVGRVEGGPDDGRIVFCLYPHQDCYVVPAGALHEVPRDVPAARAVLAANLETAVNAVWDAAPLAGDRVAVVGAGTVGCLVAWLAASVPGTEVELVDVSAGKARVAASLGVGFRQPPHAARDADLVFHASATAEGLATALDLAGFEATVAELSWYGAGAVPVALGGPFHSLRLTLRASQVGAIGAARRARFTPERRMRLVMTLLADPKLDSLITGESAFGALPATMARLAAEPGDTLCHRISYA